MPFINIDKKKNMDTSVITTKDPESLKGGLIQEALTAKPADGAVETKMEGDVKVISKPFGQMNEEVNKVEQPAEKPVEPAETSEPVEIIEPVKPVEAETGAEIPSDGPKSEVPEEKPQSSTLYPTLDSVKQADQISDASEIDQTPTVTEKFEAMKTANTVNTSAEVPTPTASEVKKPEEIKKAAVEEIVVSPQITSIDGDIENVSAYMDMAISKNASDVHFTSDYPVYLRVDGKLQKIGVDALTNEQIEALILPILDDKKQKNLEEKAEIDMMYEHSSGNRFRVNVFRERGRLAAAFRLLPKKIRTIDELSLPTILKEFSKISYGLVVVTGPTGSGKSTTIAAMIEEINRTDPRHIITIEDPVEYIYEKRLALIAQRNMYEDTQDWPNALRAVLRQDPNVVVIGEMRDYETIASALTIAETGHLVFATLHTNSAAQTIDRIIDVFPEGQQNQVRSQLSSMLSGVISQRLIPLKNGGRKPAVELLIGTVAVKNAIREGKTHQIDNIIQTSSDIGMIPLEKSLVDLVRAGEIDVDTAKTFTAKPDQIDLLLK